MMNKILNIPTLLDGMLGKNCCRQRIGEWKSLRLGFGRKIFHSNKAPDPFYGEWEVGTYSSNWAIYLNNDLLFDSKNEQESNGDLDKKLRELYLGSVSKIELINNDSNVKLSLNNNIDIYYYEVENEIDTELVHFFIPNNIYLEFHPKYGWKMEKAIK